MNRQPTSCPDDLFAAAQHRRLSELEAHANQAHLKHCGACRATAALTAALAEVSSDEARGAALISRLAGELAAKRGDARDGSRRPEQRRGAGAHRKVRARAVGAALIITAAAVAASAWIAISATRRPAVSPAALVTPAAPHASAALPPRSEPEPNAGTAAAPATPPDALRTTSRAPVRSGARAPFAADRDPSPAASPATAAELFAQANSIRRGGDLARAIADYRRLERTYPLSEESFVAAIALGELLLERREAAQAKVAFDRYLDGRPTGTLAEEALFGRARSLRALGRPDDERRAWRELGRRFPGSLYREAARVGGAEDRAAGGNVTRDAN